MTSSNARDGPVDEQLDQERHRLPRGRPLLALFEGRHDIEFLCRLSRVLSREEVIPCDLESLLQAGRLILVPLGGGILADWCDRFSALGCPEFFLVDRECEPETAQRRLLIQRINARPGCRAQMTAKRSLECYIHRSAISTAGGGNIEFGDDDVVANILVRSWHDSVPTNAKWIELPRRTRQRLANRAKRWLSTTAVEQMTGDLLAQRDPEGEVIGWFNTIIRMAQAG